ncbi:WhiB family transcriptional regulator [Mycobacterium adipatum]|uniref:WhiB family transcriptional regulator n=1 Tax=Mycobacterium adipatum TaxID=1682113 RepID=UPI0034E0B2AA
MSIIGELAQLFVHREPWIEQALCREVGPDDFFPCPGETRKTIAAKRVCGLCEVRQECLEYAVTNGERFGVWGGLSPGERHRLGWSA